jgi:hypothetical protein
VGSSFTSSAGNGAVILTVPDPPINLANVVLETNGDQIGLIWSSGLNQGGTPIIDYRIYFD